MHPGDLVTQHAGRRDQRDGRVVEIRGANAVVRFDCGLRLVPIETLTPVILDRRRKSHY